MPRIVHYEKALYLLEGDGSFVDVTPKEAFDVMAARELGSQQSNEIRLTTESFDRSLKSLFKQIFEAELAEVIVGVNPGGKLTADRIKASRWLSGSTASLYRFLTYGDKKSFESHPAQPAVNFLWLSGGNYVQLVKQVRAIGDIRVAYANVKGKDKYVDAIIEGCQSFPTYQVMKQEAKLYLAGDVTASTWLAALLGNEQPNQEFHTLVGGIMTRFQNPIDGLMAGWMSAMRLLVAQWLATEYHPDLLNEHVFAHTTVDAFAHGNYKQWLKEDGSRN